MKYKVAKEMPHIAIGTEVKVESGKFKYMPSVSIKRDDCYEQVYFEHELPYLIENGWIKEIKPREWILEIDTALNGEVSHAVRPADAKGRMLHKDSELVKIREVIE